MAKKLIITGALAAALAVAAVVLTGNSRRSRVQRDEPTDAGQGREGTAPEVSRASARKVVDPGDAVTDDEPSLPETKQGDRKGTAGPRAPSESASSGGKAAADDTRRKPLVSQAGADHAKGGPDVVKAEGRPGPPLLLLRTELLDSIGGKPEEAEFVTGEEATLVVALLSHSYAEVLQRMEREASRARERRALGIEDDAKERPTARSLSAYELVVGRPPRGWTEHVSIQVERAREGRDGPRLERMFGSGSGEDAVVFVKGRCEHVLKFKVEAYWRLPTSRLQPGKYQVTTVYEMSEDEAKDLKTWRWRLRRCDEFWFKAAGVVSRATRFRSAFARAREEYDTGRYDECIETASKVVHLASEDEIINVCLVLAKAYDRRQDHENALRFYRRTHEAIKKYTPMNHIVDWVEASIARLEKQVESGGK